MTSAATRTGSSWPRSESESPVLVDDCLPEQGGLPLGLVLGLTISVLVAMLLGGLTAVQLRRDERREVAAREGLLAESLVPLAVEIEKAAGPDEIEKQLSTTVRAEIAGGSPDYNLILRDNDHRIVGSALSGTTTSPPEGALRAEIPVRSAVLAAGGGTLTAWQVDSELAVEFAKRRHEAWIDIGIAVLAIIVVIQLTSYLLVTRPLNHLLETIRKMEMGYPAKLRRGDVARELRWLAWRFHQMSSSLTNSARLLVAAHRRAMEASKSPLRAGIDPGLLDPLELDRPGENADQEIMRQYLRSRCAILEGSRPGDLQAREVALLVWEKDAVEAERIGEMELRSRAENAALTVLDPMAFERVTQQIERMLDARTEWREATDQVIRSALVDDGVSLVAIQHRAKHAAGVWRKMQEKNLEFDEVHDLIGFRIVVQTKDDCYLALNTIHRLFEPEPFRFKDYIAEPKTNGYQSLHTSVRDPGGLVFEVQIRTVEMHRAAEKGMAAHWRYRARKLAPG